MLSFVYIKHLKLEFSRYYKPVFEDSGGVLSYTQNK